MGKKLLLPFVCIANLTAIIILRMEFVFLILALLPSAVAWFADSRSDKPVFKTVFACNFAATLPSLYTMLMVIFDPPNYVVVSPMRQPEVWMIVYLGAAAGWSLIFLCRFCTRVALTVSYKYRVASMEAMQKKLGEEWGEDVTQSTAPSSEG